MKKLMNMLAVLIVVALSGFMMAGACDDAKSGLCGPCGTVANGDATITGNAQVDGIFKAIGSLKMRTGSIQGSFDAQVRAMAEGVFGIDVDGKLTADIITEIKAQFEAQIKANVDGELTVKYEPPKCQANLDVAVSAQAQCEAKVDASCDAKIECEPGELSVSCEGKCEGSCSAECSVPTCKIEIDPGEANCSAECKGSCTAKLEVAAECNGTCNGSCDGKCSAYASTEEGGANAECAGQCDGKCEGSCTMEGEAALECSGECHGECVISGPEAKTECTGELGCEGECSGECSGSCEGNAKAPKCSGEASCNAEASAKCEAQASAQASAELKCTPPSLAIDFNWKADLDANAKAEVLAKLDGFKAHMVGIIQGWAELRALVEGSGEGEAAIDPPVVTIAASAEALLKDVKDGKIEFEAKGLIPCAIPAFQESISIIGSIKNDVQGTISGQVELMATLSLP